MKEVQGPSEHTNNHILNNNNNNNSYHKIDNNSNSQIKVRTSMPNWLPSSHWWKTTSNICVAESTNLRQMQLHSTSNKAGNPMQI